jgi:hypothetical protein
MKLNRRATRLALPAKAATGGRRSAARAEVLGLPRSPWARCVGARSTPLDSAALKSLPTVLDLSDPVPASPAGGNEGSEMENRLQSELRRAANDRIFESVVVEGGESGFFACECGSGTCIQQIEISLVEYAASRSGRILTPGHEMA